MYKIASRRCFLVSLTAAGLLAITSSAAAQTGLRVFVPNSGSDSVSVFETNADGSLRAVTTITDIGGVGASSPTHVAVRGDQAFAYVTLNADDRIAVIDTATNTVVETLATGDGPRGVTISPDGTRVYVANNNGGANSVSVFAADPSTGRLTAQGTINTGGGSSPRHVMTGQDGSRLYIVNQGSNAVQVVDTSSNTIIATVPVGTTPTSVAINADGTRLYTTNLGSNTISVIDTTTNTVVATVASGAASPIGIAVNPVTGDFYVTFQGNNQVRQFDATSNTLIGTVSLPDGNSRPRVEFSADGTFAYAADTNNFIDEVRMFSVDDAGTLTSFGVVGTGDSAVMVGLCGSGSRMLQSGGTFVAGTSAALGCFGERATFAGGTLRFGEGTSMDLPITVNAQGGTINTNGNDATVSGTINGSGTLTKSGTGTLTLTGTNTYSGGTTVTGGTLRVSSDSNLGAVSGRLTLSAATLQFSAGATLARQVTLDTGTSTIDTAGFDSTMSGAIDGSGALVKAGTGTLTLSGTNTYTGGTTIDAGTLRLTSGGSLGSGTVTLNDATLQFDGSASLSQSMTLGSANSTLRTDGGTVTLGGSIGGSGALVKTGGGTLALTGANTYSGGTTLGGGTLRISSNASLGSDNGTLTFAGGTLAFGAATDLNRRIVLAGTGAFDTGGFDVTVSRAIEGTGDLVKNGAGTLALGSANSYNGATIVNAGTLRLDATGALGNGANVTVGANATLALNGAAQSIGVLTGEGAVDLRAATLTLGAGGASSTFAGRLGGSGGLVKAGAGTLTLSGTNSHGGGTHIMGGTLSGTTSSLQGAIINDSHLLFNQSIDGVFGGTLSGSGTMTKSGAGVLALTGSHAMTGVATVLDGTLAIDGTFAGSVVVENTATFAGRGVIGGSLTTASTATAAVFDRLRVQSSSTADASGRATIAALGRLDVAGNLTLGRGSVYRATVTSGVTPLITAGGTASVDGAIIAIDVAGSQRRVTQAAILTATGGLHGTPILEVSSPALEAYVVQNDRSVFATVLNLSIPLTSSATTTNGTAAGSALDRVRATATGDLRTVTRELAVLDDADLGDALDRISGEVYTSALQVTAIDSEAASDLVRGEVANRAVRSSVEAAGAAGGTIWTGTPHRFWGRMLGQRVRFDDGENVHGGDIELGGFAVGMDRALSGGWLAGGGGSYGRGTLTMNDLGASSHVSSIRAFGYVGYGRAAWTTHAGASVARSEYDTRRSIAFLARLDPAFGALPIFGGIDRTATGEVEGLDTSIWSEWRLQHEQGAWVLQPAVGIRHAWYGRNAWTETGADALSLTAPQQTITSTQADARLQATRARGRVRPQLELTYRRELGDGQTTTRLQFASTADAAYIVNGIPFAANRVIGTAGFAAQAGSRTNIALRYRFDAGANQLRQSIDFRVIF